MHSEERTTESPGRLKIVKYPWHTAHDYELCKLPHELSLLRGTHRRWKRAHRPIPAHVRFVDSLEDENWDIMILHVDQWTWHEIDKRRLFIRYRDLPGLRKVIINHGCNMVDGCNSDQMRDLVRDHFVVCNSSTSHRLWSMPRSRYIHHGMSPKEWPRSNFGRNNIVVNQPSGSLHAAYRNNDAVTTFERSRNLSVDWIGRDRKFDSFDTYRRFLGTSSIFFSPSYASPNPRARTEAMLCGLAIVTTNCHGEENYIEHGVNGFASNDMATLYEALDFLTANPKEARLIGERGRETARRLFTIDKFVMQWNEVLMDVLTG